MWHVRLGAGQGEVFAPWTKGNARLELRAAPGRTAEQVAVAHKRFLTQFGAADSDRDGLVTAEEVAKPKPVGADHDRVQKEARDIR